MLDVKGAFDNVSKERLINTMKNLGVPSNIINWTDSFTTDRHVALSFDNEKDEMKPVDTGIPQRSPISLILFLLYLRPLFDRVKRYYSSALCLSYIDNVSILVSNKKTEHNTRMLKDVARTAFRWAHDNAVSFDDSKSELIHFENTHKKSENTVRLMNGTIVQPKEHLR